MKTIQIAGKIKYDCPDDFERILLTGEDGLILDLVSRVGEIKLSFPDRRIQVNYWLSNDYCTKNKMLENFLNKFYGSDIKVGYEDNGFMGSEWTGYISSSDTILEFGGHNFYRELRDEQDRFIIIEFNIHDIDETKVHNNS